MRGILYIVGIASLSATPALAQTELSFFGGAQDVLDSTVSGSDPSGIGNFSFNSHWEDSRFSESPNFGVRVTWWQNEKFGWGLELNRVEIRADSKTLADNGLSALTLSDGLSVFTVNTYRRWPRWTGAVTPYIGAGLGISVPDVEFDSGGTATSGGQGTGAAMQVMAGASYALSERWSVFGEYKGSISANSADLFGDGELNATVVTNALNLGVSLGF